MKIPKFMKDNIVRTQNTQTIATKEIKSAKAGTETPYFYGVRQVEDGTVFVTLCPKAATVQIAGEFNNWQPERNPMQKVNNDGVWRLKLRLSPGTYRYRLVIDGRWQHDTYNKSTELNPYGEFNSVLTVS